MGNVNPDHCLEALKFVEKSGDEKHPFKTTPFSVPENERPFSSHCYVQLLGVVRGQRSYTGRNPPKMTLVVDPKVTEK